MKVTTLILFSIQLIPNLLVIYKYISSSSHPNGGQLHESYVYVPSTYTHIDTHTHTNVSKQVCPHCLRLLASPMSIPFLVSPSPLHSHVFFKIVVSCFIIG